MLLKIDQLQYLFWELVMKRKEERQWDNNESQPDKYSYNHSNLRSPQQSAYHVPQEHRPTTIRPEMPDYFNRHQLQQLPRSPGQKQQLSRPSAYQGSKQQDDIKKVKSQIHFHHRGIGVTQQSQRPEGQPDPSVIDNNSIARQPALKSMKAQSPRIGEPKQRQRYRLQEKPLVSGIPQNRKEEKGKEEPIKQYDNNNILPLKQDKIQYFQENPLPEFRSNIFKQVHAGYLAAQYQGRQPRLGFFGKYYCGGPLGLPNCECCNGYCGPHDGQNCIKCMRLDQLRRGLQPAQLVNTDGAVCWINENNRYEGTFTCGNMVSERGERCGSAIIKCYACERLNRNIDRYRPLFERSF